MKKRSDQTWLIRRARSEDIAALVECRLKLHNHIRQSNNRLLQLSEQGRNHLPERYLQMISDQWTCVLVAEEANASRIVGMAIARASILEDYEPSRVGRFDDVWVEPSHRKLGVCRSMLREALKFLNGLDIRVIDLSYAVGNKEAENTWQNLGFEPILTVATGLVDELYRRMENEENGNE